MTNCFLTFALIAFCSVGVAAQLPVEYVLTQGGRQWDCDPDYTIEYIRSGKRRSPYSYEGDDRVWLRLVNTSRTNLRFSAAAGVETSKFVKGEGKELNFYYEAVEKENCLSEGKPLKELPIGYTRVEVYYEIDLAPGKCLVFSVPRRFLTVGRAVYLNYERVNNGQSSQYKKAYYFGSQLSKVQ